MSRYWQTSCNKLRYKLLKIVISLQQCVTCNALLPNAEHMRVKWHISLSLNDEFY